MTIQDVQIADWLAQRRPADKTFLDKVYARQDADKIEDVLTADKLDKKSMSKVLAVMAGTEAKLLSFNRAERIVLLRVFICVREIARLLDVWLQRENKTLVEMRVEEELQQSAKFMIALYLAIARTSLSIDGKGFLESLLQKFELNYSGNRPGEASTVAPR